MYRTNTKHLFGGGSGAVEEGVVGCTCDDVMQVACDALDKDQHSEVHCAAACVSSNVCCLLTASMNGTVNSVIEVMMIIMMIFVVMPWVTCPKVACRCLPCGPEVWTIF